MSRTSGEKLFKLSQKQSSIIRFLRFNPGRTSSEITGALQLKRANSYNMLSTLYDQRMLVCGRISVNKGERGRIPERWYVNAEYGYVMGVEFWNWRITAGLLDFSGKILDHKSTRVPIGFMSDQQNDFSGTAIDLMQGIIKQAGVNHADLLGIGFVVPGRVDPGTREGVFYSHQKGQYRSSLPGQVETFFGLPVMFQHNQITYAMAEYSFGGGQGISNQLTILWRSEIGAAAIQKDRLFFADPTRHLRFGHMIIDFNGSLCRCGQRGCLMNYVSEPVIIHEIARRAKSEDSFLTDRSEITMDSVSEAIRNGDKLCTEIVFEAGKKVGVAVLNLLNLMDLELINVIGYTDALAAALTSGIRRTFEETAPAAARNIAIKHKGYDPLVGVRGAAETFLNHYF